MCNKICRYGTTIVLGTELCGVNNNGWSGQSRSRRLKCIMNTYIHTWETRSRGPTALVCPTLCGVLKIKADHANVDGVFGNMDVKSL